MEHLLQHTRVFLKQMVGYDVWTELQDDVQIVLAHPSTSAATQQRIFLYNAVLEAGLLADRNSADRMHFIEEAEAATWYCFTTTNSLLRLAQFQVNWIRPFFWGALVTLYLVRRDLK